MTPTASPLFTRSAVAIGRVTGGIAVISVLVYAYALRIAVGDANPFDYFGYFTNQTSMIAGVILLATGMLSLSRRRVPLALTTLRGLATSYILVVAVIYNLLVPGTGSAPPWVSTALHLVFPLLIALDWLLIGDRPRLSWTRLWWLVPYPSLWLIIVLSRGATDGWVPYGFLLPDRGIASLLLHIAGLLATVLLAGALVWIASRSRGILLRSTRSARDDRHRARHP